MKFSVNPLDHEIEPWRDLTVCASMTQRYIYIVVVYLQPMIQSGVEGQAIKFSRSSSTGPPGWGLIWVGKSIGRIIRRVTDGFQPSHQWIPCGHALVRTIGFGWGPKSFPCLAVRPPYNTHQALRLSPTSTKNLTVHRSSHGVIRSALPTVSSRVGRGKYPTSQSPLVY